jgi:osmotically-inducible protein OsmY
VRAPPEDSGGPARLAQAEPFLDGTLAVAVRRELDHGADLGVDRVEVQVRDGVATLRGEVPTWYDALHAVQLAETTRGLRAVVNQLRVEGSANDDERLAWRIAGALDQAGFSPQLVRARSGRVELSGKVASLAQKQSAEDVAHGVPGVREVDNRLLVEPHARPSDQELRATIEKRLESSGYADGQPIAIAVNDGVVNLGGTLGTLYARRRILELASIDGVKDVDAQALLVSPRPPRLAPPPPPSPERALPDAELQPSRPRAGSDESLQQQVASRLHQHPSLAARKLHVAVDRRVAILSGSVDSDFQSSCAERAAGLVRGVRGVDNQLRLEPSKAHLRDDAAIERALREELWWDARLDPSKLEVAVHDGTATVSGQVDDWEQLAAVAENVGQVAPLHFVNLVEVPE